MKVIINENSNLEEEEIIINCKKIEGKFLKIIEFLKIQEEKICGNKDGRVYPLNSKEILFFESVDKKTFIYTDNEVYETTLRLYELEEKFAEGDFFRSSKSTIINITKIKSINPLIGGKVEVVLDSDERLLVSRQYVKTLKRKLDY